jgi:hypothetical protein
MKYTVAVSVIAGLMLALASVASDAGQGKGGAKADRTQQVDRDRSYDRDRIQGRTRLDAPDRTRDRDRDMDKDKDQIRDRDRIHTQDPLTLKNEDIYGNELMTEQERNQYRKQMKAAETRQERERLQEQHEKRMQERALQQNKDLVPPGQGKIYGGELMSVQERNAYREQQRLYDTEEGMQKFQAQHREEMQKRAAALGRDIEEAP